MHVACTWVSAVWPWACMQRPEEGAFLPFQSLPHSFKTWSMSQKLAISTRLVEQRTPMMHPPLLPEHYSHRHMNPYVLFTWMWWIWMQLPTLAQHSMLSYPLHHRPNPTTLFSQTGSVTDCGTLQPGSGWQAAPRLLLLLYHIPLWSTLEWQRKS